jgi:hypothetical protein
MLRVPILRSCLTPLFHHEGRAGPFGAPLWPVARFRSAGVATRQKNDARPPHVNRVAGDPFVHRSTSHRRWPRLQRGSRDSPCGREERDLCRSWNCGSFRADAGPDRFLRLHAGLQPRETTVGVISLPRRLRRTPSPQRNVSLCRVREDHLAEERDRINGALLAPCAFGLPSRRAAITRVTTLSEASPGKGRR